MHEGVGLWYHGANPRSESASEIPTDRSDNGAGAVSNYDTDIKIQTGCLLILTTIAVSTALYWLKPVIVPLVWAVFLSAIIGPIVDFQHRRLRIPHPVALTLTLSAVFVGILLLGGVIAGSLREFAANLGQFEAAIKGVLRQLESAGILERFDITLPKKLDLVSLIPSETLTTVFSGLTNVVLAVLSRGLLVMLFVIFLMLGRSVNQEPHGSIDDIHSSVKRYISTKVLVSATTGALVFASLSLLGVPYAVTFGAFAFILNFIPNVGSMVSTLLPLPVIYFLPDATITTFLLVLAIPGMIQLIMGNVVEPKLMGKSLDLHPVTVLLALVFWGMIWGFEGMILGVPVTSAIRLALEKMEMTRPVARLMAGNI